MIDHGVQARVSKLAQRWVAVHLDGLGAQCAHDGELSPWIGQLPPAALVPFWDGEPVRADLDAPGHLRGAGLPWPAEAGWSWRGGSGRLPVVQAWDLLLAGGAHEWKTEDRTVSLDPAEAIATVAATAARRFTAPRSRPRVALTVPDSLSETQQQQLLDCASRQEIELKLLWRPVSAALAWVGRFGRQVIDASDLPADGSTIAEGEVLLGDLVVLHLGAEAPEVALLALIARWIDGQWRVLPGRRRPGPALPSRCGREAIEALSAWMARQDRDPGDTGQRQWRALWSSPQTVTALAALRAGSGSRELGEAWARTSHRLVERLGECLTPALQAERARARSGGAPLGVVLTGALAGIVRGVTPLGLEVARTLGLPTGRLLVDGIGEGRGLCACGTAEFLAALERDEIAYLDTLPRLRIAALRRGEPVWEPLFNADDRWVPGGRRWRRDPPFEGLSLRRGQQILDLTLHHEELPTVRAVQVELTRPVEESLPVTLEVTVEPAQGRARIQVIPERPGALGRRPVWIELGRMRDTGHDPATYLEENYPRAFPPLHPRMGSRECWRAAEPVVMDCLEQVPEAGRMSQRALGSLDALGSALLLREQGFFDRATGCREASAVDSEGRPAGHGAPLAELVERLLKRLKGAVPGAETAFVRTIGYSATLSPEFERYLVDRLRQEGVRARQVIVRACGWCLRSPQAFELFVRVLLRRIVEEPQRGHTDWIKSLSQVLRFREEATRDLASSELLELCRFLRNVFRGEVDTGVGNHTFTATCLSLVYLLRRRAFDDQFLAPEGRLASELRSDFQRAITLHQAGRLRLRAGRVDLACELARMIDYVDRRGHGLPGIGVED